MKLFGHSLWERKNWRKDVQQPIINEDNVPTSDNIVFKHSSFFQINGFNARLPSPTAVRNESGRTNFGPWTAKPPCVPFFPQRLVVKYGRHVKTSEAKTMWAIFQKLKDRVPVPEVYGWCCDGEEVFIYMQLVEGPTLDEVMHKLPRTQMLHIMDELRIILHELRSIRQGRRSEFLGTITGEPLPELMFRHCSRPAGPFCTVAEFNDYLITINWPEDEPLPTRCTHSRRPDLPDGSPIVFTHADLTPTNIIISMPSSGGFPSIAAIIDFEQSGWYPAYWEACKSISNANSDTEWAKNLPAVLAPWDECLDIFDWMISAGWGL